MDNRAEFGSVSTLVWSIKWLGGVSRVLLRDVDSPAAPGKHNAPGMDGRSIGVHKGVKGFIMFLRVFLGVLAKFDSSGFGLEERVTVWDLVSVMVESGVSITYAAVHHAISLNIMSDVPYSKLGATV